MLARVDSREPTDPTLDHAMPAGRSNHQSFVYSFRNGQRQCTYATTTAPYYCAQNYIHSRLIGI